MEVTLQQVDCFRAIYALCDVKADRSLKATHYTCVLEQGPNPTWGVFSARTGALINLCTRLHIVEKAYPSKVWKRKQSKWTLGAVQEALDVEVRRKALRTQMARPGPKGRTRVPPQMPVEPIPATRH